MNAAATQRTGPGPGECFTVKEFCVAHRISVSTYYKLKALGEHPDEMPVGRKVLISKEAAARWRKKREAAGREISDVRQRGAA